MKNSPSMLRQIWLEDALKAFRPYFRDHGHEIPATVRISIGWPRGSHGKGKAIGQCWSAKASTDGHNEIFISPALGRKADGVTILATIAHELVHATVGLDCGHKGAFKRCATDMGLEGKMTATTPGAELTSWCEAFIAKHGAYPAGALDETMRKKQSTRLLKCECATCGYVARVTRKWVEEAGEPYCGDRDHGRMSCGEFDGEDES